MKMIRFLWGRLKGRPAKQVETTDWATVPNAITGLGLLCIGIYVGMFKTNTALAYIPVINAIIILTDIADGIVADWLNQHTALGKILDPLRDRLHVATFLWHMLTVNADGIKPAIYATVAAELAVAASSLLYFVLRAKIAAVHSVGKGRADIQWSAMLLVLTQMYWLDYELLRVEYLIKMVAGASVMAAIFYSTRSLAAAICAFWNGLRRTTLWCRHS
jgi:phosphatidylglycerophosphate synthase